MKELSVELFGIVRRLPMRIELVAGNLDVYELLEPAHDETIIALFGLVEQKLGIAFDQFFSGCAEPAQLKPRQRVIGFVRRAGVFWTYSRCNGRFEADEPGVAHKIRDKGDIILVPVFQPIKAIPSPVFLRSHTSISF